MAFKGIFPAFVLVFLFLNVNELKRCIAKTETKHGNEGEDGLTNIWAVELDTNDEEVAKEVARSYGYDYGGRIGSLPMHFKFVKREEDPVDSILKGEQADDESESDKHENKRMLEKHPRVKWVEQQRVLVREKQGNVQ